MRPSPFMLNQFQQLTTADKVLLLQLARSSIGELWQPELQDAILQIRSQLLSLDQSFACFVTIHLDGKLRGCIGTLQATRPLLDAICYYAKAAACQDPRFPPLRLAECSQIRLSITLLGQLHKISADNKKQLIDQLVPREYGLYIKDEHHSATFLPMVWQQLSEPAEFVDALFEKGGWLTHSWPEHLEAWIYSGEEFSENRMS